MQRPLLLLALVGLTIIAGVSLAGYYLGNLAEQRAGVSPSPSAEPLLASPSPSPSPSASPVASPVPSPTPSLRPRTLPTAPPAKKVPPSSRVHGTFAPFPSVLPTIDTNGSSAWNIDTSEASADTRIVFLNLPSSVHTNESFTVQWRVEGPQEDHGDQTTLSSSLKSSSEGTSSSSSSTQSLGSFTIPKTFSTKQSFGGTPGTIHLRATAEVGGKHLSTEATVELVR